MQSGAGGLGWGGGQPVPGWLHPPTLQPTQPPALAPQQGRAEPP